MKVYEAPSAIKDEEDNDEEVEYAYRHVGAKEHPHIPNNVRGIFSALGGLINYFRNCLQVYHSLQRPVQGRSPPNATSQTLHKYRGPEVVTTSNRIQESCI